jgi:membrane-bound serine protease (ClpP class)
MVNLGLVLVLCVVGLGLIACETLLPGGILGFLGFLALGTGVGVSFIYNGLWPGLITLVSVLLLGLAVVMFMFKKLPDMKMSKGLCLDSTLGEKEKLESTLGVKVGDVGVTLHLLRPSGKVDFSGVRVDVVSSGAPIEAETQVQIVTIEGARVVVEAL